MLLPQSFQYPNLSEGADSVGGQLRGDRDRVPLSMAKPILAEFGGRCRKSMFGVCVSLKPVLNRRFPEIAGKDNLTVFSYSGRVKSPEWRRQLRRADLRQF